jgi:hypothetical protein
MHEGTAMTTNALPEPAGLDAVIYHRGLGLVRGHIRQVAGDGLCVDIGPIVLHADTPVEVALLLPRKQGNALHRLPALVVGSSSEGLELRFPGTPSATHQTLLDTLRDALQPPVARRHGTSVHRSRLQSQRTGPTRG